MKNIKLSALVAAMFLIAFSEALAQETAPEFRREFHVGANIGGGTFAPRFLYKRVGQKLVLRTSLSLGFSANSDTDDPNPTDSCLTSMSRRQTGMHISAGIGFEKRKKLSDKAAWYFGGEIRPEFEHQLSHSESVERECAGYTREEENTRHNFQARLNVYPFIGFRYSVAPRFAISVEAGPTIGLARDWSNGSSILREQLQGQAETVRERPFEGRNYRLFANLLARPFVSLGIHF